MLIKVPDADEISFESTNCESLKVKDLIEKLSDDLKEKELIFVANGFVLDPTKSLKEYDISDTSIIHCLAKHRPVAAHHPKERARSNLPPNPVEVVKSFRVLIDQLDMPFGEKLKDIVNNEETFASLLTTVPGLREDQESVKMLKDLSILKHYVKKDNIGAIKERHPALLCAISQINKQLTSSIDTLTAMQNLLSRAHDEDMSEDDDFYGGEDDFMDTDDLDTLTFPPAPSDAPGQAAAAAASSNTSQPRLTADFFSQALDNVLAGRSGGVGSDAGFTNPLALLGGQTNQQSSSQPPSAAAMPFEPSEEQVKQLVELGIAEDRARAALIRTAGNFDRALDLLFSGEI